MGLLSFIATKVPVAASIKRELVAVRDSLLPPRSYSQCGEDRLVLQFFNSKIDVLAKRGFYIEIGANQPSQLSNTYLFYRMGAVGILVEPDVRCCALLRRYRPRDVVINALAGPDSGVGLLYLQKYTGLNSSMPESAKTAVGRRVLPRICLDDLWKAMQSNLREKDYCFLLSIDTEGGEEQILAGGAEVVKNSYFICLEHHGCNERREGYERILGTSFEVQYESGINLLFRRKMVFEDFVMRQDRIVG